MIRFVALPPVGPTALDAEDLVERALLARALRAQRVAAPLALRAKVARALGARLDHRGGRLAKQIVDLRHLVRFVLPREERLPRMHLDQYAAEAPHVNRRRVRASEQHLRRAVEAALDVGVDRLPFPTRGAKINNFDATLFGMSK